MIKIITDGYYKGDTVLLEEISCNFCQDNDCTEPSDDCQVLTLSTRDGGGGKFINIKTDSWSISEPEDFLELLRYFKKLYNKEETKE